jgi:DNA adenine methylase
MPTPHPLPYQGSKRQLAPTLLKFIPADTTRLVEPFAGSGALSLAIAQRSKNIAFVLNDINAPLIALWDAILHRPRWLADGYAALWVMQTGRERRFYDAVRTRFNRTLQPHYFLYLLARCVKAAVRYNQAGEFNQSPDNRRKGKQPSHLRDEIIGAASILSGRTSLFARDYKAILRAVRPDDVIYLDPPYQGVSAQRDSRYLQSIPFDELVHELECLNAKGLAFIVSYDGVSGAKKYGRDLPLHLRLEHFYLQAGRSAQATLLGRTDRTVESVYLSAALKERLQPQAAKQDEIQLQLW